MIENIQLWTNGIIEGQLNSPIFFIAVFLLGLLAAVGSACNLGVLAAVTSYAGTETTQNNKNQSPLKTGFSFFLGNVISLSLVGALTGFVSQSLGNTVGAYWTIIAGVLVVYLGLVSLDLLPSSFKIGGNLSAKVSALANKGFIFGLALGGFATACSVSCSPIFPIILGASFLQGSMLMGWLTLFIFAIGYSLPLGGILVGLGFGFSKFSDSLVKNKSAINGVSGFFLIIIGFGLLLGWV